MEGRTDKAEAGHAGIAVFKLILAFVMPEIRITDKGLTLVPEMTVVPAFEPA